MTQPVHLFLIRHGNTFESTDTPVMIGKQTDMPLTEKGIEQARNLADFFYNNNVEVSALFSGRLQRQTETAYTIIKKYNNLINQLSYALEEINYGQWENKTIEEIKNKWGQSYNGWTSHAVWPNEFEGSYQDRTTLFKEWLELLKNQYAGKTVLAVTSQGAIKLLLSMFPEAWQGKSLEDFKVKTGHFCEVIIDNSLMIKKWNQAPVSQ